MSANPPPTALNIIETGEDGVETVIGKVEMTPDGKLKLKSAVKDRMRSLAVMVQNLNSKEEFHLEIPPGENDPRFAVRTRVVARDSPDVFQGLTSYMQTYYKLTLG